MGKGSLEPALLRAACPLCVAFAGYPEACTRGVLCLHLVRWLNADVAICVGGAAGSRETPAATEMCFPCACCYAWGWGGLTTLRLLPTSNPLLTFFPGAVRTKTFVAVGQETSNLPGSTATHDRANLLLNMELGGMSAWHKSDKVGVA